jgi:hypothetical protein
MRSYTLMRSVSHLMRRERSRTLLYSNTAGHDNTASGSAALNRNTTGWDNTASGSDALYSNTTGNDNTASGSGALYLNTTGGGNTASGEYALNRNTTGNYNTASGTYALWGNARGYDNSASGAYALYLNTTGYQNTASGSDALIYNTAGHDNIGLGYLAGSNIVSGSNNIDIGNPGTGDESKTIHIGTQGTQRATYIAGISGSAVSSTNLVCVSSGGQLGVCSSSARYKRDIRGMGAASSGLMKLRPVVFRYRSDAKSQRQCGLIAEEVARVYPELVDYDHEGKPLTVRYLELNAMLLNEFQKQSNQLQTQVRETQELAQRLQTKDRQLARAAA